MTCEPDLLSVPVACDPALAAARESAFGVSVPRDLRKARRDDERRAGHRAARHLIRRRHRLAASDEDSVEIQHVPAGPERGRPFYRVANQEGPYSLSISHSRGWAIAALARRAGDRVGVDIEAVEHRGSGFESLALSRTEIDELRGRCGSCRWTAVTRVWVLKEALVKALGVGLSIPLTQLTVRGADSNQGPWTFEVPRDSRARWPSLRRLGDGAPDVAVFDVGGLLGAWVVLPPVEDACRR